MPNTHCQFLVKNQRINFNCINFNCVNVKNIINRQFWHGKFGLGDDFVRSNLFPLIDSNNPSRGSGNPSKSVSNSCTWQAFRNKLPHSCLPAVTTQYLTLHLTSYTRSHTHPDRGTFAPPFEPVTSHHGIAHLRRRAGPIRPMRNRLRGRHDPHASKSSGQTSRGCSVGAFSLGQ